MGSQAGWHQTGPGCGNQATSQGKGNFVARGSSGRHQAEHLEGKLMPVPRAETETVVADKEGCPDLCPSGPQPLPAF